MKVAKLVMSVVLCLVVVSSLQAQVGQTGSIRGIVVDNQKSPLPGVTITVTSPALMGKQSVVTAVDGTFRFPPILPPGVYSTVVELQGFNTVKRDEIIVRVGQNAEVNFEMTQAQLNQEVTVVAPSPTVDVVSTRITQNATTEIIRTLPFANRDVWTFASATAAGVRGNRAQVHGEGSAAYTFSIDGIQANASDQNWPENSVDFETVDEVEFVTGGVSAASYGSRSGYMNVVTKSGGNQYHGEVQGYYTDKNLQEVLPSAEQLTALGISKPMFAVYSWDASGTLGGPIFKDKLWFFGSFRYFSQKQQISFIPTTLNGVFYGPYDQVETRPYYFGKLTYQVSKSLKLFTMFTYVNDKIPHYYYAWNMTAGASANNNPIQYTSSNALTWVIDPDTLADLRFGLYIQDWTGVGTAEANLTGPTFSDSYTGYTWGKRNMDSYTYKENLNVTFKFIRYQDDFLGGNHEFQAGAEWARTQGEWGYWSQNAMSWVYYNGNPYYYRGLYGLTGPHPLYGDGNLTFSTFGTKRGGAQNVGSGNRYGGFLQDTMTINNRLTIALGLRYDYFHTKIPVQVKTQAPGDLPIALGEAYFVPVFGFNPYKEVTYEGWDKPYPYSALAPNIGVSYDLFGDGKTALKFHYGTYFDPAATGDWSGLQPSGPYSFNFRWWDTNGNGQPDFPGVDNYVLDPNANPLLMQSTTFKQQINPNVINPYTREILAQIEHELFPHLKVGLTYVYRDRKNITANLNFDRTSKTYWNLLEQHPEWWVPFSTTVPAYGAFPARDVTVYWRSNNAPASFTVLTNNPLAKFNYHGVELTFEKRMHNGWSLGGNFNYSFQWDNGGFANPNSRINAEGRRGVPWWAKFYGTFNVPYGFRLSFIFVHTEGGYWARSVSISAPTAWITANNVVSSTVNATIEAPDLRRNVATDNMDFRVEKEFKIGSFGRLGIFADIFNLFGAQYPSIGVNPGGTWRPTDNNTAQGTFTPGQMIVTGISGVRSYRFSFRFSF